MRKGLLLVSILLLISKVVFGQEVTSTDSCGVQLIECALKNNTMGAVKLINSGCDPNSKKKIGSGIWTCPLRSGIHHPNSDMAKLLLSAGADPNLDDGRGMSPFHYSAGGSSAETFKLLLESGGKVNTLNLKSDYPTPLVWAVEGRKIENVKLLVKNGAVINPSRINGFTSPLHVSVFSKNYEIAEYLLESGADPNSKFTEEHGDCISCPVGISPIHTVGGFENDSLAILFIDLLEEHGADLNIENGFGQNVIEYHAPSSNPETIKYLITKDVSLGNAINRAAMYQSNEVLKVLLDSGADPNNNDNETYLPLVGAVLCCGDGFNSTEMKDRIRTVEILLKGGADPTEGEESLLEIAYKRGLSEIISICNDFGYK